MSGFISKHDALESLNGEITVIGRTNERAVKEYIRIVYNRLKALPEVEIIRCKDCKYYEGNGHFCDFDRYAIDNGYCYTAEREEE